MKKEIKMRVTKKTNIAKLIDKYPFVSEVFLSYGLHCVGCFASSMDTIEDAAKIHGMTREEIHELVSEINEVINNPELLNEG